MRDEHVGQVKFLLQVVQQVQNLRLNRNVQRGDWLVGDDQLWPHSQRARNADTLFLAAGKLMRVAFGVLGAQSYRLQQLVHNLHALLFGEIGCG